MINTIQCYPSLIKDGTALFQFYWGNIKTAQFATTAPSHSEEFIVAIFKIKAKNNKQQITYTMSKLIKGYRYECIIRPWKKGKGRYEYIKWLNGYRNFWERISKEEYDAAIDKKEVKSINYLA